MPPPGSGVKEQRAERLDVGHRFRTAARPLDDPHAPAHARMQLSHAMWIADDDIRLPRPDLRQQQPDVWDRVRRVH